MSDYMISNVHIYNTLTSINLFPSLINSISLRLINITNILALPEAVPYS